MEQASLSWFDPCHLLLLQVEQPVPEQFKTTVAGAKLSTVTAESV